MCKFVKRLSGAIDLKSTWGRKLQLSDTQLQISLHQRRLCLLNISILPINFSKKRVISPNFRSSGRKFFDKKTVQQFSDSTKY